MADDIQRYERRNGCIAVDANPQFKRVKLNHIPRPERLCVYTYNRSQKLLRQTRKTASYLKPQAIENSFKRAYGEVEDNIIIYTGLIIDVGHRSMTDDKMYLTDVHAFLSVKVTDVTK